MAATDDGSFAQGMFVTLWPKVERCHDYVELLLAAQETLQHTVAKLMAGLQEANDKAADTCSIERYADRLRRFPARVEALEKKLVRIRARLVAMKKAPGHEAVRAPSEESYATTPLF